MATINRIHLIRMKIYYQIILLIFCNTLFIQANSTDSIVAQKHLKTITVSQIRNKNNTISISPDSLVQYGNSLNDILSFFPSLENDMEGNIRLRGSDKITFLINGKPTSFLGTPSIGHRRNQSQPYSGCKPTSRRFDGNNRSYIKKISTEHTLRTSLFRNSQ